MVLVPRALILRHEDFHRLAQQILARPAKKSLRLRVQVANPTLRIDNQATIGESLEDRTVFLR